MCQCSRMQLARLGLRGGEVGDRVHDLGAPCPGSWAAAAAGDLQGLGGVRKVDADGDGDDLQAALFDPAVPLPAGEVGDRNVGPGHPGQLWCNAG